MTRGRSWSIRTKTTVFVVTTVGVLVGLVAFISFASSLSRILAIETDRALEELELVQRQMGNSLANLGGTNSDWAWWDDSHQFVKGENPDFLEANVYEEAFTPLEVDLLAYLDAEGKVIHDVWYFDEEDLGVPEELLDHARPGGDFADFSADAQATPGGLVQAGDSVFLVTTRAILPSALAGEPAGVLLMGRNVDAGFVSNLVALTGLDVALTPCAVGGCDPRTDEPTFTRTSEHITAATVVDAADGNPALQLRIIGPRTIYAESVVGIRSVLIGVIAVGVVTVLLTVGGLRRLVVRPLEQLGSTVAEIGRTNDPSLRATAERRDEIGNLAADLNVMLARLECSQNELLAAKAEIESASAAKSKFLSRVSHEVRTPLNGVLAYAQLLQLDHLDPDSADSVDQIVAAARHITRLVDEFLDIARIEAGAIPLSIEIVDPSEIAEEVIALTRPVAAEHGTLVVMASAEAFATNADSLRLRQVLLNLISNAIKYGGTSLPVEVSTKQDHHRTLIIVKDYGPGIQPDHLDRLFVPFDRLDADQGSTAGTGIGLSVTKQLVELMNGSIEVVSEPGTGTAFIVSLPNEKDDVSAQHPGGRSLTPAGNGR